MPRIRNIKPQFWLDEDLGEVSRDVRLLYIGLWNLCDDFGVFEWRPGKIKAQLFPYDNDISGKEITVWLSDLALKGNAIRFEAKGKSYGFIPGFPCHQDIKNPSKWRFATPPEAISTPALPHDSPSPTPALPVGKEYRVIGKELEVVGKENNNTTLSEQESEILFYLKDGLESVWDVPITKPIEDQINHAALEIFEASKDRNADMSGVIRKAFEKALKTSDNPNLAYVKTIILKDIRGRPKDSRSAPAFADELLERAKQRMK